MYIDTLRKSIHVFHMYIDTLREMKTQHDQVGHDQVGHDQVGPHSGFNISVEHDQVSVEHGTYRPDRYVEHAFHIDES